MATDLKAIHGTNGVEESVLSVTIFAGHVSLVKSGKEPTRRCVQISIDRHHGEYGYLTDSGIRMLIAQLQSVLDGNYEQFED